VNPSPAAAEMLSIEQDPLVDGLGEIRGGAGRAAASFGFPVVTSSDDDDRHPHVGLGQPPLNVGAGHSRHVEIEDRAIGTVRRRTVRPSSAVHGTNSV